MDELQKAVKQAVGVVQGGALSPGSGHDSRPGGSKPAGKLRRPYSMLLTQPHLKVCTPSSPSYSLLLHHMSTLRLDCLRALRLLKAVSVSRIGTAEIMCLNASLQPSASCLSEPKLKGLLFACHSLESHP